MDKERPITVMVVDQHEEICASLAHSLDRLPAVEVLAHTTNLILAAELAHEFSPDVILVDFTWGQAARPDMLRWFGRMCPQSPLVVYSSYYTDGEREAFQAAGASRCLLKGLGIRELGIELRKVLHSTREEAASAKRR
jgi:DNA-binding NarL/FixJ family response regulator